MFPDHSLQPQETTRLLALGLLAEGARAYDDLALEIRRFTARVVGPNLDLLGSSLEILKLEGWAVAQTTNSSILEITPAGLGMLDTLLAANLRTPLNDVNRLALLIKLRFLRRLPPSEKQDQLALIAELIMREEAWVQDLASDYPDSALADWLALELSLSQSKLAWLNRQG